MDIKAVLGDAYHEGMTAEEMETALADVEMIPKSEVDTKYVPKATADKYASDAGKYRKERNAAQTDVNALNERIKELERTNNIADMRAKFAAQGFDAADAQAAAEAMADGDTAKFMELNAAFATKLREKAQSDKLHGMGTPPAGSPNEPEKDYDKLLKAAEASGNVALMVELTSQRAAAAAQKH